MNSYKVLNRQTFSRGEYSLVPIRFEDRMIIMNWRNEQIYHLRQTGSLTEEDQNNYFNNVVSILFDQEKPQQILFSYLKNEECIGYGGLVHINWIDKNAEISFIMNTILEKDFFEFHWKNYLLLLQEIAFNEIGLHKIYTYAFDLRPRLYVALQEAGFKHEATLKQHCRFNGKYMDVLIHSSINQLKLRKASLRDLETTFKWAINNEVRKYSFNSNSIAKEEHISWFEQKLQDKTCLYLILENSLNFPLGSIRIDMKENNNGIISYLIDPLYHGRGYGKIMLSLLEIYIRENAIPIEHLIGFVMENNIASIHIFEALGYTKSKDKNDLKFIKEL